MTKIDIISGFLGAGKTTLIKKLLAEALANEKVVLIENEFGEVGIDGGLLKDSGIQIREINSGCICCSLVGDFSAALKEMLGLYRPDRVIIEPSGVGKLSDVLSACTAIAERQTAEVNMCIAVVDAMRFKMYLRNFSEFFRNQIEHAETIVLSRTQNMDPGKLDLVVKEIRSVNKQAGLITTPWEAIGGATILEVGERGKDLSLERQLLEDAKDPVCDCHTHHNHGEVCPHCGGEHTHDHHHAADQVFDAWGTETVKIFTPEELKQALKQLEEHSCGRVLRAKGIVRLSGEEWCQFDYVPEEVQIRQCGPDYIGRLCVIGEKINKAALAELFDI